ncbi:MAG: hypothetical protein N2110_03010 [Flavobacteriales bacterium]|nr:hypothetical protein [Flavobacteriales bacterium]
MNKYALSNLLWSVAGLTLITLASLYLFKNALLFDSWHNNDELAHTDYVFKLAHHGRLPYSSELVDRELVEFSSRKFGYPAPEKLSLTDFGIGLQAYSYEALQPPTYYVVLAIPEAVLSHLGIPMEVRLRALRICSVILVILGWAIFYEACLPVVRQGLVCSGYRWFATGALALFSAGDHYHISNDQAGLLFGSLTTKLLFQLGRNPSPQGVYRTLGAIMGGVAVKLSNALWLLPWAALTCQLLYTGRLSLKRLRVSWFLVACLPLIMVVPVVVSSGGLSSDSLSETARMFSVISPGLFESGFFVEAFYYKAFSLQVLGILPGLDYPEVLIFISVLCALLWIYLVPVLPVMWYSLYWLVALWPTLLLVAGFLNRHVGSVFWFEFRIFTAYYPVLILFHFFPWAFWRAFGRLYVHPQNTIP